MNLYRTTLMLLALGMLVAFSAPRGEAMIHKKKARKEGVLRACLESANKTCGKVANKECSGKSGFKKDLCEKSSRQACMEAAKKTCQKQAG